MNKIYFIAKDVFPETYSKGDLMVSIKESKLYKKSNQKTCEWCGKDVKFLEVSGTKIEGEIKELLVCQKCCKELDKNLD